MDLLTRDAKPRIWMEYLLLTILALVLSMDAVFAGETTTTVTTYVVRTQEEREQTRWTLTEWLRIKERMKLMDVWLAMFSDPNKNKFQPELNISYLATRSSMERKVDGALTTDGTGEGKTMKAQVWMTNLFSSTIGIRSLNIDLGFEAGGRDSGVLTPSTEASGGSTALAATVPADSPAARTNWYTLNTRIFGKHIQDTSLVLKYGLMTTENSLHLSDTDATPAQSQRPDSAEASGITSGAELQIYLTKWLGLEGSVYQHRATSVAYGDHTLAGTYGEGLGFIEVGILRLQGGIYEERWNGTWSDLKTSTLERGYVGGIKILL